MKPSCRRLSSSIVEDPGMNCRHGTSSRSGTAEKTKIDESRKPEDGRVLCRYGDPGLGKLVSDQHETGDGYSDEVVRAAVEHIEQVWDPSPTPAWVTAVPPVSGRGDISDIAQRIAVGLGLPYAPALEKVESTRPQHEFANSFQKRGNVEDVFEATDALRDGPVLHVDDTVNSQWTLTEAGMTLRDAGSDLVYPFALAERTNR